MTSRLRGHTRVQTTKSSDLGNDGLVAANHSFEALTQRLRTNLMDLPTELHLLIGKELTYPDALSLKHTSRYFYNLVDTGVRLKVAWLMERRMLHLDCPNDRKCNLRTDLEFCRGSVKSVSPTLRPFALLPEITCYNYGTAMARSNFADIQYQQSPDAKTSGAHRM